MSYEQQHEHETTDAPLTPTETCPLCGSRISREEFLKVQAKIRSEVQSQARLEIERISALKDRERDQAVASREADVRKQVSEKLALETREALRRQQEDIEQVHRRQLVEFGETRDLLETKISALEAKAEELRVREEAAKNKAAEKVATLTDERDQALEAARRLEADRDNARVAIEADILQRYDARLRELNGTIEQVRAEKLTTDSMLQTLREEHEQQMQNAQSAKVAEIQQLRETLEREQKLALYEKSEEQTRERERWQKKIAELERQVENKTPNDLGDATQFHVLDALRNAYPTDSIIAIAKGKPGADIRHEVRNKGTVCGKILLDAKNHKQWRNDFVAKLKEDQRTEQADYAILATMEFPSGKKELCIEEDVIVTSPARVVSVVDILRRTLLQMQKLRLTTVERENKTQRVYEFITSEKFRQQLGKVDEVAAKLGDLDVDEQKEHQRVWKKRGQLVVSLNDAHAKIESEIGAIIEE